MKVRKSKIMSRRKIYNKRKRELEVESAIETLDVMVATITVFGCLSIVSLLVF